MILKKIIAMLCVSMMLITPTAFANTKQTGYNYNYWGNAVPTATAYTYDYSYQIEDEAQKLNSPSDMVFDDDGNLYVADTGNNRIVVFGADGDVVDIITSFGNGAGFSSPASLTISPNGNIYVVDTGNNRIVKFDAEWKQLYIYQDIENEILPENFEFVPLKVVADKQERIYVIAQNVVEGLMSFESDGEFSGYFGTIPVKVSMVDYVWKLIATEEQRSKIALFIPTEFTGLDMDDEGFIYTTDVDYLSDQNIKKLNPSGRDVLINYTTNDIIGDLEFQIMGEKSGPSRLADITYRGNGIYSALDTTRGRVFTYDSEGNLLYVFGDISDSEGSFKAPVAIESYGDNIYVLDKSRGVVDVFTPSEYGELINEAVSLRYDGNEASSVEYWEEVLQLDNSNEMAYRGIGKAYLSSGDNEKAVEYLERGMDMRYYSIAYRRYRNDTLKEMLPMALNIATITAIAFVAYKVVKFVRRKKREDDT